nr:hypothetical protein GCMLICPM_00128 [White spot syndrome virus]WRY70859.1 hypothetical protein GGHGEOLK_00131 [White spot syndrome virus]WRY71024.1 hypothetical protein OACAMADH_00125 [White spot syndrome virus]BDX28242.1 MAG: hypothetical protein [White spot syndrome virus]BDX28410.1 MAG: hypothetical protein [White spot syndrome virus]
MVQKLVVKTLLFLSSFSCLSLYSSDITTIILSMGLGSLLGHFGCVKSITGKIVSRKAMDNYRLVSVLGSVCGAGIFCGYQQYSTPQSAPMALLSVFCCTATAATSTIVGFWISMIIQALKRSNKDII